MICPCKNETFLFTNLNGSNENCTKMISIKYKLKMLRSSAQFRFFWLSHIGCVSVNVSCTYGVCVTVYTRCVVARILTFRRLQWKITVFSVCCCCDFFFLLHEYNISFLLFFGWKLLLRRESNEPSNGMKCWC